MPLLEQQLLAREFSGPVTPMFPVELELKGGLSG